MTDKPQKTTTLGKALAFVTDLRILATAAIALLGGAGGMRALGDAGVTATQADSISRANDAPIVAQQKRQDTALMRIYFRQDVQMTEAQKAKADSLMRAALQNIHYGGTPQ